MYGLAVALIILGTLFLKLGHVSGLQYADHLPYQGGELACNSVEADCGSVHADDDYLAHHHHESVAGWILLALGVGTGSAGVWISKRRPRLATIHASQSPQAADRAGLSLRLADLDQARSDGLITDQEHATQRRKIIDTI